MMPLAARSDFEERPALEVRSPSSDGSLPRTRTQHAQASTKPTRSPRNMQRQVPVLIIDRSPIYRTALAQSLDSSRFQITGSYANLSQLSQRETARKPCLALVSVADDLEVILSQVPLLRQQNESFQVVLLVDRYCADELIAALGAGVSGYLVKHDVNADLLARALDLVLLRTTIIFPEVRSLGGHGLAADPVEERTTQAGSRAGQKQATISEASSPIAGISPRERTILEMLTHGASNKHIARELNIAEATVKVHVKSLLRKIGVTNRTQAAIWEIRRD